MINRAEQICREFLNLLGNKNYSALKNNLNCDDKELKTMIRATPGLFLWKKDLVLGKWHHFDFPSTDDINEEFLN